jgi:phage-related protein
MNDYVEYLNALQASSIVAQMGDQKQQEIVQAAQQGIMDKILPTEEESQIPGLATGGLGGILSIAKNIGEGIIKESLKTQMKNVGIDDNTISSVLKGDLNEAMTSKVGEVISNIKGTVSDTNAAVTASDGGVFQTLRDSINAAKGVIQDAVDTASSTVDNAISQAQSTISNGISSVQNTVSQAEGIASDLASQAQQEYQNVTNNISLADYDTGSLFSRVMDSYKPSINNPQSIEMVDFAAPEDATIAPEISSTISGALSNVESGVSGITGLVSDVATQASSALSTASSMLSGAATAGTDAAVAGTAAAEAAGEAVGDTVLGAIGAASSFLGPLGIFAGLIGGIVGAVEMHKDEEKAADIAPPPQPILNPSAQFL